MSEDGNVLAKASTPQSGWQTGCWADGVAIIYSTPDTCSSRLDPAGAPPPTPTSASCAPPEDVRSGCGRSFLGSFPKKAGRTLACWFLTIKVLFPWSDPATPNRLGLFCPRGINRQDAPLPP